MCGIVGAVSTRNIVPILVQGLQRLEYRGYDSAGIALLTDTGMQRLRAKGKVSELEALQAATPVAGCTGIAHTRWATHGAPTEGNAHPHATDKVAVATRDLREPILGGHIVLSMHADPAATSPAVAEAVLDVNGTIVRIQAHADTMNAAIDALSDRLSRRLHDRLHKIRGIAF